MTQEMLAKKVGEKFNTTKAEAGRIVDFIGKALLAEMLLEGKTSFPGLGNFSVVTRKARTCHNPQDPSKKIDVPAKKDIKFKALGLVKKAVNE